MGTRHATRGLCGRMPSSVLSAAQGSIRGGPPKVAGKGRGYGRLEVRRGDVVTIVLPGAYGKPRPALVIQSDLFDALGSLTVLPITSELGTRPRVVLPGDPRTASGVRAA